MMPPIFATVNKAPVQALLKTGNGELRFYSFGRAPQLPVYPYATWQTIGGSPENFIGDRPDMDGVSVQVDVFAKSAESARAVVAALQHEIEGAAYVTFFHDEARDPDTNNFSFGFDCDWLTPR